MPTGDVFKVTLDISLDSVECRPGFYLIQGVTDDGGDPVGACIGAVNSALGATPLAGFVANATLHSITAADIQPGTAASQTFVIAPHSGTIADDNPPPPQDSMVISLRTAMKMSKGIFASHGRIYMPGIYSTGQVSGFLTEDLQDALLVFTNKLVLPFVQDGSEYQMNVISFTPGSHPRTIRAVNPVTAMRPSNQVGIQRRRRPGRGI